MAHALAFDTLGYAKKLEAVGVPQEQAEVHAEALAEIIDERLATKQDILDLRRDMKEMEMRLTIKLGTMLVIAIGVFATLVKLL